MLDLVGRKADGWLPTLHYLVHFLGREPESLYEMRRQIHNAAFAAGRLKGSPPRNIPGQIGS